jgi:hypothetical protein
VADAVEHEAQAVEHEIREARAYVEVAAETVIEEIRAVE